MKKTLAIAGLVLWIAGSGWYYTCKIKERCYNGSSPGQAEVGKMQGGSETINPLMFAWESEKPLTGTGFTLWRDSLTQLANQGTKLQLSGLYNQSEKNRTNKKDLGLARAKMARALFPGVPDALISLTSRMDNSLSSKDGKPIIAVTAEIIVSEKSDSPEDIALDIGSIYFPSNSSDKAADPRTDKLLNKLAASLKNSSKTLEIIGHTDNVGSDEVNYSMGLLRARSIRSSLIAMGAPASQITASSKGEKQPVGPSETEAGRAKNRRTEIIVK